MSSGEKLTLDEIIKSVFKKTVSDDLEERRFRIITDDDLQEQIDELKGEEPLPTDETLKIILLSWVWTDELYIGIRGKDFKTVLSRISEVMGTTVTEDMIPTLWDNASDYEKLTVVYALTLFKLFASWGDKNVLSFIPTQIEVEGQMVVTSMALTYLDSSNQIITANSQNDLSTSTISITTIGGGNGGDTPVPVQEDIYYEVQADDVTPIGEENPIPVTLSDTFKDIVEDFKKILYINPTIMQAFAQNNGEANIIPSTKWYPYGSDETADNYAIAYQYISCIQLQWMIVLIAHELKKDGEAVDNWTVLMLPVDYVSQDYVDSNFIRNSDLYIEALYGLGKSYLREITYSNQNYLVEGIKKQDVSVNTNQWVSDNTYAEYPYKATITITPYWTKTDTVMEVVFNVTEALSGNFAPVCNTYVDTEEGANYILKVEIYAKAVPSSTITIPLIKEVL